MKLEFPIVITTTITDKESHLVRANFDDQSAVLVTMLKTTKGEVVSTLETIVEADDAEVVFIDDDGKLAKHTERAVLPFAEAVDAAKEGTLDAAVADAGVVLEKKPVVTP